MLNLFNLIESAKTVGSYSLANAAFAVLLDKSLDVSQKKIKFFWETEGDDDFYYDLAVISDGLREVCIPAPLLRFPKAFKSLSVEIERRVHDRRFKEISLPQAKKDLTRIKEQIIEISPNVQELINTHISPQEGKFPSRGECRLCPHFVDGHNRGAIHCTVNPSGHPNSGGNCPDWELDLGLDQIAMRLEQEQLIKLEKQEREKRMESERLERLRLQKIWEQERAEGWRDKEAWSLGAGFTFECEVPASDVWFLKTSDLSVSGFHPQSPGMATFKELKKSGGCLPFKRVDKTGNIYDQNTYYQALIEIEGRYIGFRSSWCSISFSCDSTYSSNGYLPPTDFRIVERLVEIWNLHKEYYDNAKDRGDKVVYSPSHRRWKLAN